MKDRSVSYIVGVIAFAVSLWIGSRDYARLEDFYFHRLVLNAALGHGVVYNPDEAVMPTIGPLIVLPTSLLLQVVAYFERFSPAFIPYLTDAMIAVGYGLTAALLHYRLSRSQLTHSESLWVIAFWLFSWPTWASWHAPTPYSLLFILLGLQRWESGNQRVGGLIAGVAVLIQPESALGCLAVGVYTLSAGWRYWQTVWIPIALWGIVAIGAYPDGVMLDSVITQGDNSHNLLWIGLGVGAVWVLSRLDAPRWWWIFPLWAALEIGGRLITSQQLALIESLPLVLTIGLMLIWASRQLPLPIGVWGGRGIVLTLVGLSTLLAPPQTDPQLAQDILLSQSLYIPQGRSLLHDRSDGISAKMIDFDGALYGLGAKRSPFVDSLIKRGDYSSLIIALAPDYIYFNSKDGPLAGYNLRDPQFIALNYRKEFDVMLDPGQRQGDELWIRYGSVSPLLPTQYVNFDFSPDMRLVSYATEQIRVGEALRIRLDWQLELLPDAPITLYLTIADASVSQIFPTNTWKPLSLSTYHVLLPATGEFSMAVRVDYKGGTLGIYHSGN